MYVLRLRLRRLPAVALMGLSNRSRVAALAERRRSLTTGFRLRCPCRSMESSRFGVHEVGQRRLEPLSADTVRGLPDNDHRFAYGLVVDAPSQGLLAFIVSSAAQCDTGPQFTPSSLSRCGSQRYSAISTSWRERESGARDLRLRRHQPPQSPRAGGQRPGNPAPAVAGCRGGAAGHHGQHPQPATARGEDSQPG